MSKRKRSTRTTARATTTRTCAAAGCSTQVNLPLSQVPLCSPCQTRLVELSTTDDLHWFTCHIETSFIRWSSHPEILPPTPPPLGIPLSLPENYTNEQALSNAAQAIHNADAVLVVAGAGMSCDSGLPDYRGAEGFYRMGGPEEVIKPSKGIGRYEGLLLFCVCFAFFSSVRGVALSRLLLHHFDLDFLIF